MGDIVGIKGSVPVTEHTPDERLVRMLEDLLAMAKAGRIESFIGCGFSPDRERVSVWCTQPDHDVSQMLGGLTWLQHEYVHRTTE